MKRTTIALDESILMLAKRRAEQENKTLGQVIQESLQLALIPPSSSAPVRRKFKFTTVRGNRPPAVDISNRNSLLDFMDREK